MKKRSQDSTFPHGGTAHSSATAILSMEALEAATSRLDYEKSAIYVGKI